MFSLVRVARDPQEALKMQYNLSKNGWQARVFWHIVNSNLFHGVRGKQTGMTKRQPGQFKPFQTEVSLPTSRLPCDADTQICMQQGRDGAFSWSNSHPREKAWCGICSGMTAIGAQDRQNRSSGRGY